MADSNSGHFFYLPMPHFKNCNPLNLDKAFSVRCEFCFAIIPFDRKSWDLQSYHISKGV